MESLHEAQQEIQSLLTDKQQLETEKEQLNVKLKK